MADTFDPSELVGQELSLVTFGRFQISLHFDRNHASADGTQSNQARIDMNAGFSFTSGAVTVCAKPEPDDAAFRRAFHGALDLIGKEVSEAKVSSNGDLDLRFYDHLNLRCLIDERGFESFHVHLIGKQEKKWFIFVRGRPPMRFL